MTPIPAAQVAPVQSGLIDVLDFSGGLNLKSTPYEVAKNQATQLSNFYVVEDGSLLGRGGTKIFNAASLGANAVSGATRSMIGSGAWLAYYQGTVYKGSDAAGTFTSSLTGLSSTLGTFIQYLAFIYFATQSDAMQKWDGTTWTLAGIAAPSGAPAGAAGAAGTPNGTYTLQYTFVSATTESNPSPASGSIVVASQNINASSIAAGPAGTTSRNVYGFKNGVSSVYQLIGSINDNVTTTFTVTTDQPSWGASAPTQNTPPVTGPWILTQWKNRLWGTGGQKQRVYLSEVFSPEVWPATYYIDIPFVGSDQANALLPLGDLLVVWGLYQLFYIYGSTPFTFVVTQSFAENGALSPWAVVRVSNEAVYLAQFGVFSFDGAQERRLSDPIEPQFTGVGTLLTPINATAAQTNATMAYYRRLKALVVSFPTSQAQNDTTYWKFLGNREQPWVQDSRAPRMILERPDTGTLWAFDAAAGILRQWDTTTSDDGANISKVYQSGAFAGPSVDSTQRYTWFTLRGQPNNATPQVTAYIDMGLVSDSFTLAFGASVALIGSAVIGTSIISPSVIEQQERWIADCIGRTIQFNITITDTTQPKLLGYAQRYNVVTQPRYFGAVA